MAVLPPLVPQYQAPTWEWRWARRAPGEGTVSLQLRGLRWGLRQEFVSLKLASWCDDSGLKAPVGSPGVKFFLSPEAPAGEK